MHCIKEVSILVMTHNGTLALECYTHQGGEVLQLPGGSWDEFQDIVHRFLGTEYADKIHRFGRAIDVIIKPEETVDLVTDVYKVEIDDPSKLHLPSGFSWYSREALGSDPRGRRDARFHLRLLEDRPLDLKFSEEQLGKWIDAKMLYWEEGAGVDEPRSDTGIHDSAGIGA